MAAVLPPDVLDHVLELAYRLVAQGRVEMERAKYRNHAKEHRPALARWHVLVPRWSGDDRDMDAPLVPDLTGEKLHRVAGLVESEGMTVEVIQRILAGGDGTDRLLIGPEAGAQDADHGEDLVHNRIDWE